MTVPTPPPAPPLPRLPPSPATAGFREPLPRDLAQEVEYLVEPLCSRANEQGKTVFTLVHEVCPVIQEGPMCGLVALSIASQLLTGRTFPPLELLRSAREKGYSKNGEMFSAEHLLDLALSELSCTGSLVSMTTVNNSDLLRSIAKQRALVVAYDADKDHSPCLARGHKAHWCTLVGFAVTATPPPSLASITHVELSPASFHVGMFGEVKEDQVCVFARQGKSRHMGLWGLPALLESNANLAEAGDHRDPSQYFIPSQGLSYSLGSVLLHLSQP